MIERTAMPARRQKPLAQEPFNRYLMNDGSVWTEFYRTRDGYLLRFPGLADFEVSADGTRVTAYPEPGTDPNTVEHLYINQLVPLALSRQSRPAFHASVVTMDGGAVAFLGKTGMGKSTLAASFALSGTTFLTDDALIIEESDEGCRARPSHPSIRLWDDSVKALAHAEVQKTVPISYSHKARLLAGEALTYCDEPRPLLAALVLENTGVQSVSIRDLTGLDRYLGWLENSFLLDIEDRDMLAQHFEWTHRISGIVPTFGLDYPRDYGMLANVRRAVRQVVKSTGTRHGP